MSESFSTRWKRRAVTIPTMLAGTAVAVLGFPVLAPLAVAADLVRLRPKLPTLRSYLFGLQYMVNDSVEILLALPLWIAAGFGTRLHSSASIDRHSRLQWWSAKLLEKRARQLLGISVEIDAASSDAAFAAGPVIVMSRHVSLLDATLPGLLYKDQSFDVRAVIMRELLNDPGFDLLYGRLGSVFIERNNSEPTRRSLERVASQAHDRTAVLIFPEGRLFRPAVLAQSMATLREKDPERAALLDGLRASLPPRPGGVLALLEALPTADVVMLDHRGLDAYPAFADLAKWVPVTTPVSVTARRIARTDIPQSRAERVKWLDDLWLAQDQKLSGTLEP